MSIVQVRRRQRVDIRVVGAPGEPPMQAQAPETVADAVLEADRHFPFDWNGWGIGVELDAPPGASIAAWRSGVRAIVDGL